MSDDDDEKEHVVWIGRVPPGLCAREKNVRELFQECGTLLSVKVPSFALLLLSLAADDHFVERVAHTSMHIRVALLHCFLDPPQL